MRAPLLLFGIAAATMAGLLIASPGQTDELSRGQMLSASCAGCHGTDGHSPGSSPDISAKSADFIRTSLMEFRSGQRPSTVMGRHAKAYSDEEIQLIAEYMGQRK